ncbi:MAG TPA: hypothetical protein VKG23_19925 [Thermoanaerobaculia bacterium]|nr:hypothetical protein [Thermoanaerobaculia bacterium]
MRRPRAGIAVLAVAVATAALFVVSKGKWSDALIDSGREWIVPDALARGELLYRDVVYWFGPFTPYFQAAFLKAFGSGFPAIVAAGAVSALAALALLHVLLHRVAGRRAAALWTALAIPALVFMPNAGGALLGMGYRIWQAALFALGAVALASRPPKRSLAGAAIGAGACAALSGLCRTEWGLAAVAAAALAAFLRPRRRSFGVRAAALVLAAHAAVFAVGIAVFLRAAGPDAVLVDGHLLFGRLPPETRHFLIAFSGVQDWRPGLLEMMYSAAAWAGLAVVVAWVSWPRGSPKPRGLAVGLGVSVGVLALAALAGGAGSAVLFSAAPLVSLAATVAGLRRKRGSPAAALAASGALGFVLSYRRPFHIGDSAYVGPPLLFAFVAAAGLLHLATAARRRSSERRALERGFGRLLAVLVIAAFAARIAEYAAIEAVPIAGTAGMLSARPEVAREIEELGVLLHARTAEGEGVAVFPEGEVLNFLSGRPNPIRHQLYLPGYLSADDEAQVLAELRARPPAAVVFWRRPVSEYDRALFGEDYGRQIRSWIEEKYDVEPFRASGAPARAYPRFTVGWRR